MRFFRPVVALMGVIPVCAGCGDVLPLSSPPLFALPLAINGEAVGSALIDTGGAYEILLRERFGLAVVGTADVLVFGGVEEVGVTESFFYSVGGILTHADGAIVGISTCACNGLGFGFFRKTGLVLRLDFSDGSARFVVAGPDDVPALPFAAPPEHLGGFDSAFVHLEIEVDGESRTVVGLLDTGAGATAMRRGLFDVSETTLGNSVSVFITQRQWGTVLARVGLFDTVGLPDVIIGVDVLAAWGDEWYFSYDPQGGSVALVPPAAQREDVAASR